MADLDEQWADLHDQINRVMYSPEHIATIDEVSFMLGQALALAGQYRSENIKLRRLADDRLSGPP